MSAPVRGPTRRQGKPDGQGQPPFRGCPLVRSCPRQGPPLARANRMAGAYGNQRSPVGVLPVAGRGDRDLGILGLPATRKDRGMTSDERINAPLKEQAQEATGRIARAHADIGFLPDVKAIHAKHRIAWRPLTQREFANLYGFSLGAVEDWEQGRRTPRQAARDLLHAIDLDALAVLERLGKSAPQGLIVEGVLTGSPLKPTARRPTEEEQAIARAYASGRLPDFLHASRGRTPTHCKVPSKPQMVVCGARNRQGKPCRRSDLHPNGRCKFHGGLSTGPKTLAGKQRALANLANRWTKAIPVAHRAAQGIGIPQPSELESTELSEALKAKVRKKGDRS